LPADQDELQVAPLEPQHAERLQERRQVLAGLERTHGEEIALPWSLGRARLEERGIDAVVGDLNAAQEVETACRSAAASDTEDASAQRSAWR
jgi:hypothetical protein